MKLGKRLYIASQGRFLQADPIEGGTPNEYTYVVDPVNSNDFSGEAGVFQWGVCIYECYSRDALAIERTGGSIGGVNKALAPYTDSNGTANLSRKSVHISGTPYRIPAIVVKPRGQQPTRNDWTLAKAYAVTLSIALSSANASAAAAANNLAKQIAEGIRKNALGTQTNIPTYGQYLQKQLLDSYTRLSNFMAHGGSIFGPASLAVFLAYDCAQSVDNCVADMAVIAISTGVVVGGYFAGMYIGLWGPVSASQADKLEKVFSANPTVASANSLVSNGTRAYLPTDIINSFRFNGLPSVEWFKHVVEGVKNQNGTVSGWHVLVNNASNRVVTSIVSQPDKYGIVKANVTIDGVVKNSPSTFFSATTNSMTATRMISDATNRVTHSAINQGRLEMIGTSAEGVPIKIVKDLLGNMITSYPIHQTDLLLELSKLSPI